MVRPQAAVVSLALTLTFGSGCAPHSAAPAAAPPTGAAARNLLPPLPGGTDTLSALTRAAPADRAIYLVDLFDGARLLGDDRSRELLWSALGGEGGRGAEATRQAIDALAGQAEHAGLDGLAALLDDDREELDGGDALSLATHRRKVAATADPSAGHALLSLYATCTRALVDAANAPPWRRAEIGDRCLYPLYETDPAPWFAPDPSARPPDPPWTRYLAELRQLLDVLRRRAPRLEDLATRLHAELDRFAEAIDRDGIAPPDLSRLVPLLPEGDERLPPYDREPWVIVEGDMAVVGRARFGARDHELVERVERMLTMQRATGAPGRVALFVPGDNGADAIETLCMLARRGGADSVELVLSAPLSLRPPRGDVWAEHAPDRRAVVLPLQLRSNAGRDHPRELESRPPSITLLAAPDGVTAFAADGAVELGRIASAPARIADLRHAFPDEAQIALAIDPAATYRDVVTTALAARQQFRRVMLEDVPRRPPRDEFAARFRRRVAARFEVRGAPAVAARAEMLRGCYLEALERDASIAGTLTLRAGAPPTLADDGPGEPALRACLAERAAALVTRTPATLTMAP